MARDTFTGWNEEESEDMLEGCTEEDEDSPEQAFERELKALDD